MILNELLNTILCRPYVFAFLVAYLILGYLKWGWRKTIVWLFTGYLIAWVSEISSIHNGFPYGEYHYIYENLKGELMVIGVPFFDSLSYPFLVFAGFCMAAIVAPVAGFKRAQVFNVVFFAALFTMFLDVITDPIATMGDKWFLGKIHYYAHPGNYFGVPLTNFGGWFLVAFAIVGVNVLLWKLFPIFFQEKKSGKGILYILFYTSIALFSIVITFYVGEFKLGILSLCILASALIAIIQAKSLLHPNKHIPLFNRL